MDTTLIKFIPLFAIITLGYILRKISLLKPEIIAGIKRLIVDVALPAVFFSSFVTMEIRLSDLWYYLGSFVFCLLLFVIGNLLRKTPLADYPAGEYFFSGFEFGMVGVALFGSIYGIDQLAVILLFGLGHELFIWFIYAPGLKRLGGGKSDARSVVEGLLHSPIIISITLALLLNLSGLYQLIAANNLMVGIMMTAEMLATTVSPLILLVIGANIDLHGLKISLALRFILTRLVLLAILGSGVIWLITSISGPMPEILMAAFITFILLPPPFIIPVFLPESMKEETQQYAGILVLYTLISLPLFMAAVLII